LSIRVRETHEEPAKNNGPGTDEDFGLEQISGDAADRLELILASATFLTKREVHELVAFVRDGGVPQHRSVTPVVAAVNDDHWRGDDYCPGHIGTWRSEGGDDAP
jgi:hypothetical protein